MLQLLFVILFACWNGTHAQQCQMKLPKGIPERNSPVYIRGNTLFKPEGCTTNFEPGEKLIAVCTGPRNSFVTQDQPKNSMLEIICDKDNPNHFASTLENAKCTEYPQPVIRETGELCSNDGTIKSLGFAFGDNEFAESYRYCFDGKTSKTIYTKHVLNGAAYRSKQCPVGVKNLRDDELRDIPGINYNKNGVNFARFINLLGVGQKYVNGGTEHVDFGHFTPRGDFGFQYERYATDFRVNGAPQFNYVNNGNWKKIEQLVRKLASGPDIDSSTDLLVFTGGIGQLKLPHTETGEEKLITFGDVVMPEAYFKVVQHRSTGNATVFITLNNPLASNAEVRDFCSTTCQPDFGLGLPLPEYNNDPDMKKVNKMCLTGCPDSWGTSQYVNSRRGYTLCCDLKSFKRRYNIELPIQSRNHLYIPNDLI